eukprot:2986803-Amphidinium_carterae.1
MHNLTKEHVSNDQQPNRTEKTELETKTTVISAEDTKHANMDAFELHHDHIWPKSTEKGLKWGKWAAVVENAEIMWTFYEMICMFFTFSFGALRYIL